MANTISNSDDVIDSRDVIARIEELREERDASYGTDATWAENYPDDADELKALEALAEEASGYAADWTYGATLIRDSYFEEYARELVSDIGDLPKDLPHYIEIDWERTARNIQMDYTAVEFDGVTYWVR